MRGDHRLRGLAIAVLLAMPIMAQATETADAAGVYTEAQAAAGHQVYFQQCATCHGEALEGKVGPALSGRQFRQMVAVQNMDGASLFQFISQHMPLSKPGSLSQTQYLDIFAYILQQNGYPAGTTPVAANNAELQKIHLAAAAPNGQ